MPIVLDPDCAGVPCNENSTCVGKKCVDSAVDCSGAECTQPGVAADGGVIEVDAFSPLVDGAPPDDGSIPDDGSSKADGGPPDGGGDGGDAADAAPDSGGNICSVGVGTCLAADGQAPTTCSPAGRCCYGTGGGSCVALGNKNPCAGLTACCHGSTSCPGNTVCCADTPSPQPTTVIKCRPIEDCTGPRICSAADQGCSNMGSCQGGFVYSPDPEYFGCS
jgi:hypothetical protein